MNPDPAERMKGALAFAVLFLILAVWIGIHQF